MLYFDQYIFIRTVFVFYLSRLVTNYIKTVTKQPRPYNSYVSINYLTKHKTSYSFPSQSTMSAIIVYNAYKNVEAGWLFDYYFGSIIVLLVMTRIYRGLHYPHDCLLSIILAWSVDLMVSYVCDNFSGN